MANQKNPSQSEGKSYEYNTSLASVSRFVPGFEFMDGQPYTEKQIDMYLRNPEHYAAELRRLAWWAYRVNGSVAAAVNYARTMHTLDSIIVCKATRRSKAKRKPRNFDNNSRAFNTVLDTIRYKEIIRDMILKCCNDGVYFYYFETSTPIASGKKTMSDMDVLNVTEINSTELNYTVIPLPVDYCKIVGRKNNSYVIAFDMRYISDGHTADDQARLLRGLPAEVREAYASYGTGKSDPWIILDNERTMVQKIRTGINSPTGEPLVIAALNDVLYSEYFISTKRNVLSQLNHQIIYQTFPEGAQKGTSALTEEQQQQQHDSIKGAIFNRANRQGSSFFSLPGGTKIDQLTVDASIFSDNNESDIRDNVATDLGIAPSALNGKANGNYATSTLNIELFSGYVYSWIENFVEELNKVVNCCVIKDTSCPVALYILPVTFANRDKFVDHMSKLYATGKGSLSAWIAAAGINPTAYLSLMDYELAEDFEHRYPVHATSYNASGDEQSTTTGRPTNDDPTAKGTVVSKTNNTNDAPKPSV